MPTTNTSLGFCLTVTNVTGKSFAADLRQNIKKRISKIVYLQTPPPDSIRLSYSGSKEINAENTLFLGDRSDRLYPNAKDRASVEYIVSGNSTEATHQQLLCTQKFIKQAGVRVPLYYKDVLPAHINLNSVKILNKNFEELSDDHWRVELIREYDESTGFPVEPPNYLYTYVFNSQNSYFDQLTGEYEVFYIQYMDAANAVHTRLLDNEPAYTEATIDDIWLVTNQLKPWCFAYFLDSSYILKMPPNPDVENMAILYTARAKIEALSSGLTNNASLWLPRVTNGSFRWNYEGYSYFYEVPEFSAQAFSPIEPYKMTHRTLGTKISTHLLKLPHEQVLNDLFARPLSIVIEHNNEVIKALTLDPNFIGSRYTKMNGEFVKDKDDNYVVWSNNEILSMDTWSGIVQLDIEIKDYWKAWCAYTYKEVHYELSKLNMNPVFDKEAHKQIRVIYLVPRAAPNNNSAQSASIQYLKIGPSGLIEEASQDGTDGNTNIASNTQRGDPNAYSIDGVVGLHYNWRASTRITDNFTIGPGQAIPVENTNRFPAKGWVRLIGDDLYFRYVKYERKTDTTLVISENPDHVPDVEVPYNLPVSPAYVEVVNFADQYTVGSYSKSSSEKLNYGLSSALPNIFSQYFVLADLSINPPHGIHDVALLDVREDGGGIFPELYDEAKILNPEVQWYHDFLRYDGQPTPGDAAVVIKIPKKILNTFTKGQIEAIIDENIPYGVKPLIRYHGYQPQVLSIATTPDGLLVCWEPMGPEFTYSVWYASNPKGPWIKHNKTRITDQTLGQYAKNCYLVDNLDKGLVYYVKITCLDKYESYWCSYTSYDSVEGGIARKDDPPKYPFGNNVAFMITNAGN